MEEKTAKPAKYYCKCSGIIYNTNTSFLSICVQILQNYYSTPQTRQIKPTDPAVYGENPILLDNLVILLFVFRTAHEYSTLECITLILTTAECSHVI